MMSELRLGQASLAGPAKAVTPEPTKGEGGLPRSLVGGADIGECLVPGDS